jgi:hypothetical protein
LLCSFMQDNTGYIAPRNVLKGGFPCHPFRSAPYKALMPTLISRTVFLLILVSATPAICVAATKAADVPPNAAAAGPDTAPEAATTATQKSLVQARKWMVSSANPLASEAGRQMLREGGSAVDAAIAMQMVLALVEPQSSVWAVVHLSSAMTRSGAV